MQLKQHLGGQTLMLDKKMWLTIDVPVIAKEFSGGEVRALCGPLKFLHTKLIKLCLYGPHFGHWGTVMLEQERAQLFPQSWNHIIGTLGV